MQWWKSTLFALLSLTLGAVAATAPKEEEPDRGQPKRTVVTGDRGNCVSADELAAFPLVPDGETPAAKRDRPVLFAYLPDVRTSGKALVTVRHFESTEEIFRQEFDPPALPAIVALRLPAGIDLQPGEEYRWVVFLFCPNNGAEEAIAHLEPIAVPPSPEEEPLWHDRLESLALAWPDDPEPWQNFMNSWDWQKPPHPSKKFLEQLHALPELPVVFVELPENANENAN